MEKEKSETPPAPFLYIQTKEYERVSLYPDAWPFVAKVKAIYGIIVGDIIRIEIEKPKVEARKRL